MKVKSWIKRGTTAMVCAGVSVISAFILSGCINIDQCIERVTASRNNSISVDGMYLHYESTDHDGGNLTCILYITNRGDTSGDIKIEVYMIMFGISIYRTDVEVGKIGKNRTIKVEIPLNAPMYDHIASFKFDHIAVEALLFEDNLFVVKEKVSAYGLNSYLPLEFR